jgi:ABC-type phosphate transport system substrate-binding protein
LNAALEVRIDMRKTDLAGRQGSRVGWILGLGLVLLAMLSPMAIPAGAADFLVIVNGSNPVASMSARDVSNLFLKKSTQWPDGVKAAPVDLDEGAAARESFSKNVHHKSTTAVKSYWQTMIFSGREIPPPEKASAQDVTAFVRANRGAIAYVPAGTALGGGVKVIEIVP